MTTTRAPTITAPARNERRPWPASIEWSFIQTLIAILDTSYRGGIRPTSVP